MAYVDAIDSHYMYVKGRMAVANPARVVAGLLDAQDWPPTEVKLDAFYLLMIADTSIGRQGYSAAVPIKFHHVQWVWINKGTDVQQGERKANRAERMRTMQAMKGELINAMFPNYAEKKTFSLVGEIWTGTSLDPVEYITWTPVDFTEKGAIDSGVRWGSASTRICDMTDRINA